jgi:Phage integrase, N-terminal SAM-like domain
MRSGMVRTRSGDVYKPSAVRSYEAALRDRVLPVLGAKRLADVRRRDVQRFVDELLGEGLDPSTVRNVLMTRASSPEPMSFRWSASLYRVRIRKRLKTSRLQ